MVDPDTLEFNIPFVWPTFGTLAWRRPIFRPRTGWYRPRRIGHLLLQQLRTMVIGVCAQTLTTVVRDDGEEDDGSVDNDDDDDDEDEGALIGESMTGAALDG
jgi:hypothetical protein